MMLTSDIQNPNGSEKSV